MCYGDLTTKFFDCGATTGGSHYDPDLPVSSTKQYYRCKRATEQQGVYLTYVADCQARRVQPLPIAAWSQQYKYELCTGDRIGYYADLKMHRHCTLDFLGRNNCGKVDKHINTEELEAGPKFQ
ncbi:hypothetical protein K435DRAFT_48951 [Dendrothele bispora CBS 962.96]|uniref:Uncharacterized protein n=1 Tax=Dendrothele bispora (strain CBS 962.96) TaxID=1314807 RepID=A0A4S8M6N3_DENBC|nr:hypothetical protein K435DRAFT_48951 [Dendrothele bispora CBS 962.96]